MNNKYVISPAAIEAGARAMDTVIFDDIKGISYTGRMLMAEKCLEAAFNHMKLQPIKDHTESPTSSSAVPADDLKVEKIAEEMANALLTPWKYNGEVIKNQFRCLARAALRAIDKVEPK